MKKPATLAAELTSKENPDWLGRGYRLAQTISPKTTATSVVAISRVRRVKRRLIGIQGTATSVPSNSTQNQCGTACSVPTISCTVPNPILLSCCIGAGDACWELHSHGLAIGVMPTNIRPKLDWTSNVL